MSLRIGTTNADSLNAQNNLNSATERLAKAFERLSSGLRINSASDDPAGFAMALGLEADARLATTAVRNIQDGISLTSVADTGLGEIQSILSRMAELAQQSANGVYLNSQRSAMSAEFIALGSEVERIAKVATFNGISLLSNSSNVTIQAGIDSASSSQITISYVRGTLDSFGLATAGSGALTYSIIDITSTAAQLAATNALSAVRSAITTLGNVRGSLGASQSRLEKAVNFVAGVRDSYQAAVSKIRDADIAADTAEMVRLQILQQAATSVLAQANMQPQVVLKLLS